MAQEIELKLTLPENAQRVFLRHPLLKQAVSKQVLRLVNLYYDTPTLDLHRRGIALRLRSKDRQWLQTVKCAGTTAGGLSVRPEWETPYAGHFDFAVIDDRSVRDRLTRTKTRIVPLFETNFKRIAWCFAPAPGTRLELALDRGWIAAGGQRQLISEVEIELLEGDEAHLFSLAQTLAERVSLIPAPLSKADRGYRLFQKIPDAPVKAASIPSLVDKTPVEAFHAIALSCFEHLQLNHAGVVTCDDPEYIHQMRVATRRLRAALRLFDPQLPADLTASLLTPLRELMQKLGRVRDYDVLLTEIVKPVLRDRPDEPHLAALAGVITERRFTLRQEAKHLLNAPSYGQGLLQILAILHTAPTGTLPAPLTLLKFTESRLNRLYKKVLQRGAHACLDNGGSLHELRISIKRLRYALEFCAPLAPLKVMQPLLAHLSKLQNTLGQINDLSAMNVLLKDCVEEHPTLQEAVTQVDHWHGPRHQALLATVSVELKHLDTLKLPKFHHGAKHGSDSMATRRS